MIYLIVVLISRTFGKYNPALLWKTAGCIGPRVKWNYSAGKPVEKWSIPNHPKRGYFITRYHTGGQYWRNIELQYISSSFTNRWRRWLSGFNVQPYKSTSNCGTSNGGFNVQPYKSTSNCGNFAVFITISVTTQNATQTEAANTTAKCFLWPGTELQRRC